MRVQKLRHSGWLAYMALMIGLMVPTPSRADPLDTVLDVLYKAGVIDGNVHAAKPLISCLASGKNAAQCTLGNAQQTELANDPQVQNVLDIYQSFSQHDWYAVLKKAGITVGCALVPGGEVKDVACGELGKIAGQVLDGAGSVVGAVGSFVTSMVGGGSDPPPMSPQDYYALNFMPWYHWLVVHQLDKDTPANVQVLNAPVPACVDYFYHHTYSMADAQKVCGDMRTWLGNNGYTIGNAFRDETDSYYQLHFAPAIEEAAENAFANNSNIQTFANFARLSCLADERKKIPLPEPGFQQCDAIDPNSVNPIFKQAVQQLKNQCVAQATQRSVPKDDDAYTRICTPIANRVSGAVLFRMGEINSRMEAAAAAGCPNSGTPKSIHCDSYAAQVACEQALPEHPSMCSSSNNGKAVMDAAAAAGCLSNGTPETIRCGSYEAHAACVNAIPEHADLCHLDQTAAVYGNAKSIWESVTTDDAHCWFGGKGAYNKIRCVHPLQTVRCSGTIRWRSNAMPASSGTRFPSARTRSTTCCIRPIRRAGRIRCSARRTRTMTARRRPAWSMPDCRPCRRRRCCHNRRSFSPSIRSVQSSKRRRRGCAVCRRPSRKTMAVAVASSTQQSGIKKRPP